MAGRNRKVGLERFLISSQLDDKEQAIQREYGLEGYAILMKLYLKIFGGYGYYCEWDKDNVLSFMSENSLPLTYREQLDKIIESCISREIFSREMYEKYNILTSESLQKRYIEATSKRADANIKNEFLLYEKPKKSISPAEMPISPAEIPIFPAEMPISATEIISPAEMPIFSAEMPIFSAEMAIFPAEIEIERGKEGREANEKEEEAEKSDIKESKDNKELEKISNGKGKDCRIKNLNKDCPLEEYKDRNKESNPSIKKLNSTITEYFPDEKLNQAFLDYKEMRVKIRKPMTQRAIQMAIAKLEKLATPPGEDHMDNDVAIEILEQSTFNSWQGLFPLRQDNSSGNGYHNRTAEMLQDSYRMMDDWLRESKEANVDDS